MNTYKITAETATGETISQTIIESTEAKARKAFRTIYRHGEDYTITDAELIAENSSATKQQERDAIEKIKAILETLGPQSYVATALDGCLEIAEQNIEFDFADSMKGRMESYAEEAAAAKKKLAQFDLDNRDLRLALEKAKQEAANAQQALRGRFLAAGDLADCRQLVNEGICDAEQKMKAAALEIVTFAEDTGSSNFQNAVKRNRAASSRWNYLLGLRTRIDKTIEAGA